MKKLLTLCLLALPLTALADGWFQVGIPRASGLGCPQGTLQAVVAPDGTAISVLFDSFGVQAPAGTARVLSASCSIIIPVTTQPGYNLSTSTIDYRGFAAIPAGARGMLTTSGPMFGGPGSQASTPLRVGSDSFTISQTLRQNAFGHCNGSNDIRFTTTLSVQPTMIGRFARPFPTDAQLSLDSLDMGGDGIRLAVTTVPCQN